ncbi:putative metal dependent response regulator (modular protein) [Desulfamplus magnetovallimortis]|uniref:Putative metal dependent response regulator (Modular protein) n=2 Tax=Desulfamplus magnetovallimortis TaxID=1246637 RepID=A0A1W1H4J2_9BACT|nr:putative metal dependent response regulator (modular protein) [Desulfamplus magnetovallimortis]
MKNKKIREQTKLLYFSFSEKSKLPSIMEAGRESYILERVDADTELSVKQTFKELTGIGKFSDEMPLYDRGLLENNLKISENSQWLSENNQKFSENNQKFSENNQKLLTIEGEDSYLYRISTFNPDIIIFDLTACSNITAFFDCTTLPDNMTVTIEDVKASEAIEPNRDLHRNISETEQGSLKLTEKLVPAIPCMVIFQSDPGSDIRSVCVKNGIEFVFYPYSFTEIDGRIVQLLEGRLLNQHVTWQERRISNAVEHIDKLKAKLRVVEKRFLREKELLHNSLKQINEMSREREQLKKELNNFRNALSANIRGLQDLLSSMIESRNGQRIGHSRRVGEIALFVADKIGLGDSSRQDLVKAAMLHEVGMLFIPDRVLDMDYKKLSRYERDMLDLHFVKGAGYLEKCQGFEKTAGIICHINENSDGSGFPDGLKKRYIPLLSRILTGADVLDTLWLDHFENQEAVKSPVDYLLSKLEDYAGIRLDPAIVNYLEKYVVTVLGHDSVRLREVAISGLKPGMVIGTGLFTRTGTKLLTPGTRLTGEIIDMLIRYNREYPVDETVYIKIE